MRKILTIAAREYRAMVATKAFVISMSMMPLLMFGGIVAMEALQNVGNIRDQKIVVIDHSNAIFASLHAKAIARNQQFDQDRETELSRPKSTDQSPSDGHGKRDVATTLSKNRYVNVEGSGREPDLEDADPDEFGTFARGSRFHLEEWNGSEVTDAVRLELSDRIRRQELYAFVEIPANLLEHETGNASLTDAESPSVRFFSEDANFSEAKDWIGQVVNELVREYRLGKYEIDAGLYNKVNESVPVRGLSLLQQSTDGSIEAGKEKEMLGAIFLPLGAMMLMFMVIFMASQPMLESVLEEKSQRIVEVLLGSANPFQLMTGKLIGTVAGSLTIFGIYLGGGYLLAVSRGWSEHVPLDLIPWFLVFQIGGVLFYASIFLAVGASVTQLKEAQTMLLPVWMLLMSPMFVWFMAIREPNGPLSFYFSLFPPATPTMMVLRMSTGATIPIWQPVLGLVLLTISTIICVYLASRIFRVGLLWQGKTPKLNEIVRWAFRG